MADDKAVRLYGEFKKWREDLRPYWSQIDKNQEMFEFYKSEDSETSSQVSLNTPYAVVETAVAKGNETNLIVTVKAEGSNDMIDFESWVAAITYDAMTDRDVAATKGSFRSIKEQYDRELRVKGTAFAEVNYCHQLGKGGKVVADAPYIKLIPYKRVIFNPSMYADNSNRYYVEKWVSWKQLEDDKDIYKLNKLKNYLTIKELEEDKQIDSVEEKNITPTGKQPVKVERIQLIECHDGAQLTVIADKSVIIREAYDPLKLGRHPILASMYCKVANRPYGYGAIDAIYKTVRAQDTIINQNIQIINRYLREGLIVSPNSGIDLDALITIMEDGGATWGEAKGIGTIPANLPPQSAFMQNDIFQQAIERAGIFSPYSSGMPSQQTDKTKGTMGGIKSLQQASEPNFQVKQDILQDSFVQPYAAMCLKMVANRMNPSDIRYALLKDKTPQWVAASKNVLLGKATLKDMYTCGMIDVQEFAEMTTDEMGFPIPGIEKEIVFDVDWIVDVKLDNQSKIAKSEETRNKMEWIEWARGLGIMFDPNKVATQIGKELGVESPEDLYAPAGSMPLNAMGGSPQTPVQNAMSQIS